MQIFERITFDIHLMGGHAFEVCLALVLSLFANSMTRQKIIKEYLYLEEEDIQASRGT